jgi:hypothetical protein
LIRTSRLAVLAPLAASKRLAASARLAAFAGLATLAGCASAPAGGGGGGVLTVAASVSGRFDSNVRREPTPEEAYGGGGEVLVRAANGVTAPTLQLEYGASARHSRPGEPGDGPGHRLSALAGVRLADYLRIDVIGRGSRGGVDEDLSPTDEVMLIGRAELQPARSTRLRGYAAHRWRDVPGTPVPVPGMYAGLELRQRFGRSTTFLVDARYEAYMPPDVSREWNRTGLRAGLGQSILPNTAIELDVRVRERRHPGRLLELDETTVARRDEDLRFGGALVYDNRMGTELRLELERDSRRSNDTRRAFDADRVSLTVRRRAFAIGSRREPPRIDEQAGSEAIRAASRNGVAFEASAVSGVFMAGARACVVAGDAALCWPAGEGGGAAPLGGAWAAAAGGAGSACALDGDGAPHCWRWHRDAPESALPEQMPVRTDRRFVQVAVGAGHACGLAADGTAWCWGENADGQLGNERTVPDRSPVAVAVRARFTAIAVGDRHSCALDDAGAAWCWGANESGQAGGSLRNTFRPRRIDGFAFSAISAGARHTCALTAEGAAWCWGDNWRGQVGTGAGSMVAVPARVQADVPFRAIVAGWAHTCALGDAGAAWCWGANRHGQLGRGTTDDDAHPVPEPVAGGRSFTSLSASFRTCALDARQHVYCWGGDGRDPTSDAAAASPRRLSLRVR